MRARLRSLVRPALGGVLAVALGGCGSSSASSNGVASKTPAQIVAAAESAAAGAATVHVAGSIVSGQEPISLDMELAANKGGKGRLALAGLGIELIDVDRAVYIKGNGAFYRRFAGPVAARLLPERWLKARSENSPFAAFASLTNLRRLIDGTLSRHGALTRAGTTTTVDGQSAVGVSDATGGGTLYVATTGTPYPIEIVEGGAGRGRIVFDRWNEPVTLAAPAGAIYVGQLVGGR